MSHIIMKTPRIVALVLILCFAFPAVSSFAVLDTTVEECNRRYGEPVEAPYTFEDRGQQRTRYTYHWAGILVRAVFGGTNDTDIRCVGLDYERIPSERGTGENKMIAAEIDHILALNANGSLWKRSRRGWIRSDGQAFVREFNFTKENAGTGESVRMNSLCVFDEGFAPEIAASIRTDSPTE
jgi:hypothetical protein